MIIVSIRFAIETVIVFLSAGIGTVKTESEIP